MTGAIIGIDVGTTSVKAAVLAQDGTVLDRFTQAYPTLRPGGHVEQDPDAWVRLVDTALAKFSGHDVSAIGLCSQANTHVFVEAGGAPLCPAILWQDGRAATEAAELNDRVTEAQKQAWWGAPMPIDASHALSRMLWMSRHRPDIWERTRYVLLPKDYCLLRLTGEVSTDPLANIGLVGADMAHVNEALALVPGAADRLAPLIGIVDVAGQVRAGPFAGKPVVSGTMDAWAGLLGAGGAVDGSTVWLGGTSEILGISSRRVVPTPGVIVFPECSGIRMHAAPTQNGGDAAVWFAEAAGITLDAMAAMVADTPRGPATPLFLPQLEGERAPLWNADLRGAFLGIGRQTALPDMARAVFEGVAFAARHALGAVQSSADVRSALISCGGGGFRARAWAQIKADVMGLPLRVLAAGEPGVIGAAILAAIGTGRHGGPKEAAEALVRYGPTYVPESTHYDQVFAVYKDAIAANEDIGRRLDRVAQTRETG